MVLKYKYVAFVCFAATIILSATIRWVPIDNESFAVLYPGAPYPTPIMPYPMRYPLLASLVFLVLARPNTLALMSPLLLAILLLSFTSVLYSVAPRETVVSAIELSLYIGYSAVAIVYIGLKRSLQVLWYFGALVLIVSLGLGIINSPYGVMSGVHQGAWKGLFNHKNVFGPVISTFLLLTIFARFELGVPSIVRITLISAGIFALLMAASTTAIIAFVVSFSLGLILSLPIVNGRRRLVVFAVFGILSIPFVAVLIGLLPTIADAFGKDLTFSGRVLVWAGAWKAALLAPLGYGFETSGGELALEFITQYSGLPKIASVHSAYLKTLLDIGFAGAGLLIIWFFTIAVLALTRQNRPDQMVFIPVLVNHAIFSSMEIAGGLSPSFSLMVLLVLAASQRAEVWSQPGR